jgi:hypothetical protein
MLKTRSKQILSAFLFALNTLYFIFYLHQQSLMQKCPQNAFKMPAKMPMAATVALHAFLSNIHMIYSILH